MEKGAYAARFGDSRGSKIPIKGGMILFWFFLAGFIAGVVGYHKFLGWFGPRIEEKRRLEKLEEKNDRS